ncbi:MAG: SGNH/GDSL hydrolase family protein [Armatimonadota bacterium]
MTPRVLIIGDSISVGYTEPTQQILEGKAEVRRIPMNGGPTIRGVEHIDEWLGDEDWDIIHFNWGLHDLKFMEDGTRQVPPEEYKENLQALVTRLQETGARLIWASTTPVPDGDVQPPRTDADVIMYNTIAREIMEAEDIVINDLYTRAVGCLDDIQQPENVHFTDEGSRVLAEWVVEAIENQLKEMGE